MQTCVLVLNCGSSSVKFNLYRLCTDTRLEGILKGIAEEVGSPETSRIRYENGGERQTASIPLADHKEALKAVFGLFAREGIDLAEIVAVGHRVVHGGDRYKSSVLVDTQVLDAIRDLIPIAPLHNPPNLTGLEACMQMLPGVPQVAVFDTAFHESMPESAYRYAIPAEWYTRYGVRKYGFHGTSHMYVARRAARLLGIPFERFSGITAHLGNGCSLAKIQNGHSVDTSMGFTPLEGVVMGTRSGDIDPALIGHVAEQCIQDEGMDPGEAYASVLEILNKESGLKALAGTNMMQDIRARAQQGESAAILAIEIYTYRIAGYIGRYWSTLPDADALVFTAGVGENEGYVRARILHWLGNLQMEVDPEKNALRHVETVIGYSRVRSDRPMPVYVIPTDEECVIGYDALYLGYLGRELPDTYPFEAL